VTRLHRKNLKPVVYVTADVAGAAESPVYVIGDMAERLATIELPAGADPAGGRPAVRLEQFYSPEPESTERAAMKWDGEWHITYEVFRDLGAAFGAVLVLIFFLIVGWFGSFRVPLVMMIAIPLSLVGILPGHWLFGAFFTATSMIGFIALAGIMVRNSVLLIDFVNLSLERGTHRGSHDADSVGDQSRPLDDRFELLVDAERRESLGVAAEEEEPAEIAAVGLEEHRLEALDRSPGRRNVGR